MSNPAAPHLNTVNAEIRRAGLPVRAVRGDGYYYYLTADGAPIDESNVHVYRASHLPLDQWLGTARDAVALATEQGLLPTPLCSDCLAACHAAGEPDFSHRQTTEGEPCGAADHNPEPTMPRRPKYEEIPADQIPAGVRFDVPPRHSGQIVEIAYGGFDRTVHDEGDLYRRETDQSVPTGKPGRVTYYRRVKEG